MSSSDVSQGSLPRTSSKALVAAVFAAIYAAIGLVRHAHFGSNAYDLGIFDQMVWHLSRLEAPASTIHGLSNMLGDHFSPIHVLYVPLSWLWPSAGSLIITQAVFFALSAIPVWIFLERRLPSRAAALLAIAYGCFWGLQRAAAFDVHEFAFAPLFIAVMLLSLDRMLAGERGTSAQPMFLASAVALCLVKEDQIPLVAACAALWALRTNTRRDRLRAMTVAASALVLFFVIVGVVIPTINDHGAWSVGSAFNEVRADPMTFFTRIVSPPVKLETALMWLLPFLFLPLASPYGLLIIPLALERFLSASPNHWGTSFHYTAPLAPILAMAAGDGLARLQARFPHGHAVEVRHRPVHVAMICLLLCAILPGHLPMWRLFSPAFYRPSAFADTAARALAMIPANATVVAQSAIAPHLSRRPEIYMLRADQPSAGVDVEYVIAAADDLTSWPMSDANAVRAVLSMYRERGYTTLFDERGWVVLKRAGGPN